MTGLPDERPSKSQRKRDHLALVELARQLAALPDRTRRHLVGDGIVLEPLQQAANMKASGARERQLKYIAQLLEKTDYHALQTALDEHAKPSRASVALQHLAEQWRERLLADDTALDALLAEHPQVERQRLQPLILEARQQAAAGKPPKAARQLFRLLRDSLTQPE